MENSNYIFTSKNIIFKQVSKDYISDYLLMINDIEIASKISKNICTYTYEDEVKWVEEKIKENDLVFTMVEKSTGDFIGNIEIMKVINKVGEIGISLAKSKQNKGYGSEAISSLMEYGKTTLGINSFELNVYVTNPRAIRCYEKVGFIKSGEGKNKESIHMTCIM